jgi:hypothetical protein
VLVGYLLTAPKAFVLGPLAVLLLLSRPRTGREWLWIALSVAAAAVVLRFPATLTDRTVRAAGAFFTGAFVIVTLLGLRSLAHRTLLAIGASAGATVGWFAWLGITWGDLQAAFTADYWATWRLLSPTLPESPPVAGEVVTGGAADLALQLAAALRDASALMPGLLAVFALGGGYLAWTWYWRVAARPLGPAPLPFRALRFSDHLVWLLIVAAAVAMLGGATPVGVVGSNLLVLMLALYAGRGLAVIQTALLPAPPFFAVLLSVTALALLPLALASCVLIGTADTWLDFRRRMAPDEGVP